MIKYENLIIFKNITPLSSGDSSSTEFAQIPLKREVQRNIPIVEGTSLKGSLKRQKLIKNGKNVLITDMKIVLFPISTQEGVHYITCPFILNRLAEEIKHSNLDFNNSMSSLTVYDSEAINFNTKEDYNLIINGSLFNTKKLSDFEKLKDFINKLGIYNKGFSIVSDDIFIFLVNNHTNISIRNKVEEENTKLFDEEQFPASTIFYSWILSQYQFTVNNKCFQLGGNKTLGKGVIKIENILKN
ncbi:RAMP superfamily CRISPR-associated protein [Clostridium oceanicum]|uniref:CRISPR type III-associated protein domain-containing protein n=1 Tax=Clostridium oceanicum TaxID=1543 RepID=A0ABN1JK10_9CLOT